MLAKCALIYFDKLSNQTQVDMNFNIFEVKTEVFTQNRTETIYFVLAWLSMSFEIAGAPERIAGASEGLAAASEKLSGASEKLSVAYE